MNGVSGLNVTMRNAEAKPRTKRAVVYLRVSTAKQAQKDDGDGYSLPGQQEACFRKADQLDAEVVAVFIDRGESAKTADRPEFQRMLSFVKDQGDIQYVILDKVDRFARNRRDDANTLFELRMAGAQLVSVKENIDETPAGQLLHAIMAGISEFYSQNLAAEALKGMTQKAKVGGTPGRAPIGYLNTRRRGEDDREIRTVVVDPDRAALVQWAFEAYASGEWTITSLTEALAEKGLRALPHGKNLPGPVQRSHVNHLLRNRYYLGLVAFNGEEYQGRHQPLVDPALFQTVQDVLSEHANGEKRRTHNHYLKSTVYCGQCGSRLCLINAKGTYLYFFCVGRQQKRTTCTLRYLPAEAVEAAVERHYATIRLPREVQDTIRTGLRAEVEHQNRRARPEMTAARRRVDELEQERRRVVRGVVTGTVPDDLAREEQARIATELAGAQRVLATVGMVYSRIEDTLNKALALLGRCDEAYRQGGPRIRRLSNQFFFAKLLITEDEDDGAKVTGQQLNEPWDTMLSSDFQAAMHHNTANLGHLDHDRGSKETSLVPPAGTDEVGNGLDQQFWLWSADHRGNLAAPVRGRCRVTGGMKASAADRRQPARSSLRPVESGAGDRWIRWTTTASVVLLAGIAAVVSFRHMHALTLAHGESALTAALIPLSVDGMIIASSMTLLADSRAGCAGGLLPWVLLAVGSAASLAANVAVAEPTVYGRLIAAWPSFALIGAYELLMRQIRHAAAGTRTEGSVPGMAGRPVAGSAGELRPGAVERLPARLLAPSVAVPPIRPRRVSRRVDADLLTQARCIDAEHRAEFDRPASAETLRIRLRIGATTARTLKNALLGAPNGQAVQLPRASA